MWFSFNLKNIFQYTVQTGVKIPETRIFKPEVKQLLLHRLHLRFSFGSSFYLYFSRSNCFFLVNNVIEFKTNIK